MEKKTWTILICSYNCSATIKDTLSSIVYQGNDDIDVFVVDDGSTENIYSIVKPFVQLYPNIVHYFRKQNGNQGSCINFAVARANSRYLSLLDSDDTFNTEDFQKTLNLLRETRYDTDLVILNFNMLFVNKKFKSVIKSKNSKTNKDISYKPFHRMSLVDIITIHSSIYSLKLLKKCNKIPENIVFSDNMLYYEVLLRANNICYLNKNIHLYNYFIRGDKQAIYLKNLIKRFDDLLKIYDLMLSIPLKQFDKNRARVARKIIGNHIYWIMVVLGNNYYFPKNKKAEIIKQVYDKLSKFEHDNDRKIKPSIVSLFGKNKYGGIFLVKFLYKFLPIKFVRATRYTKEGKKEAKAIAKAIKKQYKHQ